MSVIGEEAYRNQIELTEVVIPDGIVEIGEEAFRNCMNLVSVTLPQGLEEIGEEAFRDCCALEEIVIPDSVEEIAEEAFRDCLRLKRVAFGAGLEEIGDEAFRGCKKLGKIHLPEGLEEIGDEAFRGCTGLKEAVIPPAVEEIGAFAFYDCSNLTVYTVGGSYAAKYAQANGIPTKPVEGAAQLHEKQVVLSGLRGHQREQVMEVLTAVGAQFREEVSGATDYLIYDPADGMDTKKYAEALQRQKQASGILFMDYRQLIE